MKKAVLYARVSTREQQREGYSISAQVKAIRQMASHNDIQMVKEFIEVESASKNKRVEFYNMVNYLNDNPGIDYYICHKVDRLTRNIPDYLILNDLKAKPLFVEQKFDETPLGSFSLELMVILAKLYSANLSQEAKKGMYEKASQGGFCGIAPIGYLNNRVNKTIVIDKEKAHYVKKAFELYSSCDYSIKDIANILYSEGLRSRLGKKVLTSSIHHILINPVYCGLIKFNGQVFKGIHKPLISMDLFEQVQKRLKAYPASNKSNNHKFILRGFLVCGECGLSITAEIQKGHIYYRCTKSKGSCSQRYTREEVLIKQMDNIFSKIELDKEVLEMVVEAAKQIKKNEIEEENKIKETIKIQIKIINKKIDRLLDSYLDVRIDSEIYNKKANDLQGEKLKLEQKLNHLKENKNSLADRIENIIKDSQAARKTFLSGNYDTKRKVLSNVSSNLVLKDRNIINYQLKEPYSYFENREELPKTDFVLGW